MMVGHRGARRWGGRAVLAVAASLAVLGGSGCGTSTGTSFATGVRVDQLRLRDLDVHVSNTGAQLTWITRDSQRSVVAYGPTAAFGQSVEGTAGTTHRVELTGLKADTLYYFRVTGRDTAYRFRTLGGTRQRIAFVSDRADARREIYLCLEYGENVTRVTTTGAGSPALSLDGTKLAWTARGAGGTDDIFAATLDAAGVVPGSVTNVTATASRDEHNPAWSPDGTLLLFSATGNIWQRTVAGGAEVQLTNNGAVNDEPSFRRDGGRIAFTSTTRTATIQCAHRPIVASSVRIVVADEKLSEVLPSLYQVYDPASGLIDLSNAGVGNLKVFVTYVSAGTTYKNESHKVLVPRSEVYTMDPTGGDLRRLTNFNRKCSGPVWTSNGSAVVYTEEVSGNSAIVQINADGSSRVAITTGDYIDRDPAAAPDGTAVLYSSNRDPDRVVNLWLIPTGQATYELNLFSSGDTQPCWSVVP